MGDISEQSLLDYIYSGGGKVKNSDLLKTYKRFINHKDIELRAKYREEFKLIIDRIAVMKSEDGEKFLFLKKRYKQQMQEHDMQCESDREAGPQKALRSLDLGQAKCTKPAVVTGCGGPTITVTGDPEEQPADEGVHMGGTSLLAVPEDSPASLLHPHRQGDDETANDSCSKSDSEHEEECTGSVGSATVALDPVEKEWIYSAACGRISDLSQLLKQDPSLANKKDFILGFTALHWAAKHGIEDMASLMANTGADVNIKAHGGYTPLHIAALHGHRHIVDLLVGKYGANENLRDYSGHLAHQYLSSSDPNQDGQLSNFLSLVDSVNLCSVNDEVYIMRSTYKASTD